ncbi:MAG: hypothetical protein AAGK74_07550 [Chloroflexota bacterium]
MNVKKNLKVIGYFFFSWGILIAVLYMMTMISIYLNDLTWQFRLLDAVLLCVSAACGLGGWGLIYLAERQDNASGS